MTEPLSVLVVDDCVDQAETLGTVLRFRGFRVEVATSGVAALQACASHQPDVILLDLMMPEMDGWEVARAVRSLQGAAKPTIIAVTGCSAIADRVRAQDAGIDEFLLKPVAPARLIDLLWDLAANRSQPCRCQAV